MGAARVSRPTDCKHDTSAKTRIRSRGVDLDDPAGRRSIPTPSDPVAFDREVDAGGLKSPPANPERNEGACCSSRAP